MAFGDGHLRAMLGGALSVPVTMGSGAALQSTRGIFRTADTLEIEQGGTQRQDRGQVLTIAMGALAGLKAGSVLAIDGTSYKVRYVEAGEDARTQRVHVYTNA